MNNKNSILIGFILILFGINVQAQTPKVWTSAEIHDAIKKLNFLGSALYVAAHPDDENTSMIAYLANEVKAETAYLSLTRGDGGQNLIGPELREQLGVIRTQELLAARRIDGGKQFFSRANDFGYSKNPDETLKIWNRNQILADVVWIIRKFQPDIIINRFSHDTGRKTHGHHTSSAILSHEAFQLAGDPTVFPEQLKYVDVWQPTRQFFNTSWWFYGSRDKFAKADKSDMLSVDAGVYYPTKGKSNTEIAAESRSQHQCQGMGRSLSRGSQQEFLQLINGDMPADKENIFDGINTTWSRVEGGMLVQRMMNSLNVKFDYDNPAASVPALLDTYKKIQDLPDGKWKTVKTEEIKDIIKACLGLFAEANADDYSATKGEDVELTMEFVNRSDVSVKLEKVQFNPMSVDTTLNLPLENNETFKFYKTVTIPQNAKVTNPYWLDEPSELGMYTVRDQMKRGLPETPRSLNMEYTITIDGVSIDYQTDIVYKSSDPVKGETYRPFEITPEVFVNLKDQVIIYANNDPKIVEVIVKSGKENISGKLTLAHPKGWKIIPENVDFSLELKGEEQVVKFELFPPNEQSEGKITPIASVNNQQYTKGLYLIDYDHIPLQTMALREEAKVVKIDLKKAGDRIGYIMGAGDAIPESLEQVGYSVDILEDAQISEENLADYDAIIIGIRAYNTNERMKFHQPKLMNYVKNGGTMIVQYNTAHRLKVPSDELGPYPFKLSRDRVSVEEAEVRLLAKKHPVLNTPNKITEKDFEGWVQERGLYFPNEWDEKYTAILSSNDPNEPPRDGGLLVTSYGKGHYIYSGYSWFRELPQGVPGAFRLFTNMISIGKK